MARCRICGEHKHQASCPHGSDEVDMSEADECRLCGKGNHKHHRSCPNENDPVVGAAYLALADENEKLKNAVIEAVANLPELPNSAKACLKKAIK